MKHLCVLVAVFLLVACKKDSALWQVNNLNPQNKTFVFGHGGMGTKYRYPMNSMESLKEVLSIGADGTEMDLQLSKDRVLVLYHGENLSDGCNRGGTVREKTWAELSEVQYKWPLVGKVKLIRVSDFLEAAAKDSSKIFTFDCKVEVHEDKDYLLNFADELYALIAKYHLQDRCFIESYNLDFLKNLYAKNAGLKLFVHCNNIADGFEAAKYVHLYGLTLDRLKISKEEIDVAHQRNLHITLYNMTNAKENLEAIQMNADFLQSDHMQHLVDVLK
jgi:glycerophosphoryl diester phosphodiesterase